MTPTQDDLWFLPLGGTGEIGMNLNLYGHDGRWLMVDCGVTFEQQTDALGEPLTTRQSKVQMADPQFIADRRDQLDGLVVTHAHEDHVGAVAYLWPKLRCPIYTTAFTAILLQRKLTEAGLAGRAPVIIIDPDEPQQIGVFNVRWLELTHSIPEPYALLIETPAGRVFHTADWKLDADPVIGGGYQPAAFQSLAEMDIDAMVCDSTNANVAGWSASEASLYAGLKKHISEAEGRVIVTCFGSNIARLHTIAKIAEACGRHLGLLGRSLINNMSAAKSAGLWPGVSTSVDPAHLGYLPKETVCLVVTGSQGEPRTALNRLSQNTFRDLALEAGDTVIFSSKVIPGNEVAIAALIERLEQLQLKVITDETSAVAIHASGHPAEDELKAMYDWVKPKLAIPVHGELHHLRANAGIAKSMGVPKQMVGLNGDMFYIAPVSGIRRRAVKTGRLGVSADKSLEKLF